MDHNIQFNTSNDIAISPIAGQVYIADTDNHCIQVLNPDLTFSYSLILVRKDQLMDSLVIRMTLLLTVKD